jgi:PLD-like domain
VTPQKNINKIEYASIGLSILGTIVAVATQQIAYVATPLTLALSVSLIDRQKQLIKFDRRYTILEQRLSGEMNSILERSKIIEGSLTSLPQHQTTIDFDNLKHSVIADRQQLNYLSTALAKLEQRGNNLTPFLTEIDLTKDSIEQLSQDFSNFQTEINDRQDSTRVMTTDLVLTEFDRHNRAEIVDLVDAVVTDNKIKDLIQQTVERSHQAQFEIFKQLLPQQHAYDLVAGRHESRQIFLAALAQSQQRLILVCPWLTNYAIDNDVQNLIITALDRGVSIDIGWGHLSDVKNNTVPLSKEILLNSKARKWGGYSAVNWAYELQTKYPDLLTLKILGTHEKFLVCDNKFAMLGSHNYMTSHTSSSEREVGIKTDNPEVIEKLVELFDR